MNTITLNIINMKKRNQKNALRVFAGTLLLALVKPFLDGSTPQVGM